MEPLAATWRLVTEPLRAPANDWEVTDAEAALAQRRLAALDDAVFEGIAHRMATVEGAMFLRRLVTETEEHAEMPADLRAFVARLARLATAGTARAAFGNLRGHALGRFLDALGRIDREPARKLVKAAGGPDLVGAAAIAEALRARAADDVRATASLARGIAALLRIWPPSVEAFRDFGRAFAARPKLWSGTWAAAAIAAIDRMARDAEAEGPLYAQLPPPPEPFDEDRAKALVDAIRARRPHAPPPFQAE